MIDIDIAKTKKILLYITIGLLSFCALVGIIAIFAGVNSTFWRVAGTAAILFLVMLFSHTNILRLNTTDKSVLACAVIALISNVFWGIPWILLVWGVFGYISSHDITNIARFIATFALVSFFCTTLARNIPKIKQSTSILKVYSSISTIFVSFICIDCLLVIWEVVYDYSLLGKFILAELILILLQWIVTTILLHAQNRSNSPQPKASSQNDDTRHESGSELSQDQLRAQIEKEIRAQIAAEQVSQQSQKEN